MSRLILPAALAATLLVIPTRSTESRVHGCAVAPPRGVHIEIGEECAIIVWDAASKTEHFIRRASFNTEAASFGFLVPTPSRPELAEADDRAFQEFAYLTAPPVRQATAPSTGCGCGATKYAGMATAEKVDVMEQKRVAGYDAAVLAATDAAALNKWLSEHGYESGPALQKWLEPYIAHKWIITAFKVARDEPAKKDAAHKGDAATTQTAGPAKAEKVAGPRQGPVSTAAVRMSFQAERPFFPYREPEDQRGPNAAKTPRLLRVYFVGTERMEGTLGSDGVWSGMTKWSKPVPEGTRSSLVGALKLEGQKFPASWWLTEFEDHSSPRPGVDEVYFRPAKDQAQVERQAIALPGGPRSPGWPLFAVFGLGLALVYVRRIVRGRPALRYRLS